MASSLRKGCITKYATCHRHKPASTSPIDWCNNLISRKCGSNRYSYKLIDVIRRFRCIPVAFNLSGDNRGDLFCFASNRKARFSTSTVLLGLISFLFVNILLAIITTTTTDGLSIDPLKLSSNPFTLTNWNKLTKKLSPLHNIYPDAYLDPVSYDQFTSF